MTRNKLSAIASRRLVRIGRLEKELAAERRIVRALSKLDYAPNQSAYALGAVKRAFTLRNQLNQPHAPNQPTAP
jgi:hypothetical protein